ncbi:ThuA domain-containing protein, partial [Embleya sp. NPDC127516]|uniref:ThuA domain-containing protein n=1 Tax=Embleya sp. NPDC127516 TaxID=3363990 RepID=UPI00380ECE15
MRTTGPPATRRILRSIGGVIALVLAVLTLSPMQPALAHSEFRVLLFTGTAGFAHDSIPAGVAMFQEEAEANHYEVVQSADPVVFEDANLAGFDALVMLQNSGMVWETRAQREALERFVHSGRGVVAVHAALDMGIEDQYPWWDNLINGGAHMPGHPPGIHQGTAEVADRVHPSTKDLPERWSRSEEWYNFDRNPRGNVHVLVTADESTYDPGPSRMGADHPIS